MPHDFNPTRIIRKARDAALVNGMEVEIEPVRQTGISQLQGGVEDMDIIDQNFSNPIGPIPDQDDAGFPNVGGGQVVGWMQDIPITQSHSIPLALILSIVGIIVALMVLVR